MTFSSSAAGSRTSVQALAITGMFTAVLAVLSILQIPMPSGVPVTLQTFTVSLCGYVLGARRGTLCVALYLLLGIIGLPVFTGMTAGIGRIFGFTGGFLYGFLPLALACGLGSRVHHPAAAFLSGLLGLAICHLLGAVHYSIVAGCGVWQAFLLVSLPYLIKDVLSVAGALAAALILRKTMSRAGITIL